MKCLIFAALTVVTLAHASGAGKCNLPPDSGTGFGRFVDLHQPISSARSLQIAASSNSRYMRINFSVLANAPKSWTLRIYDLNGRPLQAIDAKTIGADQQFWSTRLSISSAELIVSADNYDTPILDMVGFIEMPLIGKGQYYSLKKSDAPDWQDLYGRNIGSFKSNRGESVGMLIGTYGTNASGHLTWTCSGTVIATEPEIQFLTAAHCGAPDEFLSLSWSDGITGRMLVDMSWDGDKISREYRVKLGPRVYKNEDIAVLTLVALDPGAPPRKAVLRKQAAIAGEKIFVIHHPESLQKQISDDCAVEPLREVGGIIRFRHRCDTESGSSGAPVFDSSGAMIGMHVTGYEKTEQGNCDNANKAISSATILSVLSGLPK